MELYLVLQAQALFSWITKGYSSKVYHPGGDGILKKFWWG